MKRKDEVNEYELRKEASEIMMSPEELRKLKSLLGNSKEKLRTNHADKKEK